MTFDHGSGAPCVYSDSYVTSVDNHARPISRMMIQPIRIVWCHVNTAMTTVTGKRFIASAVPVGEIGATPIIGAPPAIVKEVSPIVVFHRVLNRGRRIPECRSFWFTRFEFGGMLTQKNVPEPWRRWPVILPGGDLESFDELTVLIKAQRLFNE